MRWRTAALGGHRDQCADCGHTAISYNSCRNRHCPRCQGNARLRWLQARERELLATRYVHVVFTLPRELAAALPSGGGTQPQRMLREVRISLSMARSLVLPRLKII
jgi:Transposase zinc-binding domain